MRTTPFIVLMCLVSLIVCRLCPAAEPDAAANARVGFQQDDEAGTLQILVDGKEALVYCHGKDVDLPHYYPVRSPSGKSMTVQKTNPYPHHRSFWFADRVKLDGGRDVGFYDCLYTAADRKNPKAPFRDHVRHVKVDAQSASGDEGRLVTTFVWEMDNDKPVLDEKRELRIVALGGGEYFLDITFTVTANYGEVTFTSDAVHYAWPYIRMNPQFSVEGGGKIVNSEGGVNQKGTNGKVARWVDYSNTVEGVTEGLAVFSHADNAQPHAWLTRDYGTFGPRRIDARSGKPFTLKKGESLSRRVGVLVHKGGVDDGNVARRYQQYIQGQL